MNNDLVILVQVKAGGRKNEIVAQGENIVIRVTAHREKGRANEAVQELIAELLDLPKSSVEILSGHTAPKKKIKIMGCTREKFMQKVQKVEMP